MLVLLILQEIYLHTVRFGSDHVEQTMTVRSSRCPRLTINILNIVQCSVAVGNVAKVHGFQSNE